MTGPNQPERWTMEGLLDYFGSLKRQMRNRSVAWILGAGASYASGIPLAGQLAHGWLRELHRRGCRDGASIEAWATPENLKIDGFVYHDAAQG